MNFTSIWTRWPGSGLLIAFPAPVVALVALGGGEPVQVQALEDAPHARGADLHLVVALEVHRDLGRAEVVVLAQIEDLADDLGAGGVGTDLRPVRAVPEPVQAVLVIAATPGVEALAADAVVAAGQATLPVISSAWRRIARRRLAILASCCSVTGSPPWLETRSVNHHHQFHRRFVPQTASNPPATCLTMPHSAPCRLDAIRVLSRADVWERVLEWWGANGWLVNGMQEVRQPALLPATRSRRCGDLVSYCRRGITGRSRHG